MFLTMSDCDLFKQEGSRYELISVFRAIPDAPMPCRIRDDVDTPPPSFTGIESRTLRTIKHKKYDPLHAFLCAYSYLMTNNLDLSKEWNVSAEFVEGLSAKLVANMDSVRCTVNAIVTAAIKRHIHFSIQPASVYTPLEACALAHFHPVWRETFIEQRLADDRARDMSEWIRENMDVYCALLQQVEPDDLPEVRQEMGMTDARWCLAFLHPTPPLVFRSMGWYPTQRQLRAMRKLAREGYSPRISFLDDRRFQTPQPTNDKKETAIPEENMATCEPSKYANSSNTTPPDTNDTTMNTKVNTVM
jgi:hypothetical protein